MAVGGGKMVISRLSRKIRRMIEGEKRDFTD